MRLHGESDTARERARDHAVPRNVYNELDDSGRQPLRVRGPCPPCDPTASLAGDSREIHNRLDLAGFVARSRMASPAAAGQESKPAAPYHVDFNDQVRPILARHCFKCHGPDDKARKAKLRLDQEEAAKQPASSGETPIVPGKPDESELVRRIFADDADELMPPRAANSPLSERRAADPQAMGRRGGEVRRALGVPEAGQAGRSRT